MPDEVIDYTYDTDDDTSYSTTVSEPEKKPGFLKKMGGKYREWKAKAPERRAIKLQKARENLEMMKVKSETARTRMATQRERLKLMHEKRKAMPKQFGGFGAMPKMPSLMNPMGGAAPKPRARKKKKRIKKVVYY